MIIAGVDEVGRGPLAGPVVTAAVILQAPIDGLMDSKKLTPLKRKRLALEIREKSLCFAFGRAEIEEIDRLNIHHATLLAMQRAIAGLSIMPDQILIDGLFIPNTSIPSQAIVKGDEKIAEISAASILAKVCRDEEMETMDSLYPGYGFADHKGYGTKFHLDALQSLGPCPIHRRSFSPISSLLAISN